MSGVLDNDNGNNNGSTNLLAAAAEVVLFVESDECVESAALLLMCSFATPAATARWWWSQFEGSSPFSKSARFSSVIIAKRFRFCWIKSILICLIDFNSSEPDFLWKKEKNFDLKKLKLCVVFDNGTRLLVFCRKFNLTCTNFNMPEWFQAIVKKKLILNFKLLN